MPTYKNILIVRTDRMGDVVLTTPTIRALRKIFPQARLTMLVAPTTQDLVLGNPDLNEVLVDDRKRMHKNFLGFLKLIQNIRSKKFDLAIVFHTKRRTNLLCFLAGIPHRVGYCNEKWGFFLTQQIMDTREMGIKHETEYCLDVVRTLGGVPPFSETYVPLQERAEVWAEKFFCENRLEKVNGVISVHAGASCPTRIWPAQHFSELIKQLIEKYACRVILVGTSDTEKIAEEIIRQVTYPLINLTGKTSLPQLISLLKRCRMLISNDSGPVHVADAVGTPVVSIFTRDQPGINPQRWRPLGPRSRIVVTPFLGPKSFAKGEVIDSKYLGLIPVEAVLEAVDALYKLC